MFGKRSRNKSTYFQKKLRGNNINDNILIKSADNNILSLQKESSISTGSSYNTSNTNIYHSTEGLTDNTGVLITNANPNDKVLFNEYIFLRYMPDISEPLVATDKSGNGLHGAWSGTLEGNELQYDDDLGPIFDFDGTDDYITVPSLSKDYFTNGFTFSAWIKPVSGDRIIAFTSDSSNHQLTVQLSGTVIRVFIYNGASDPNNIYYVFTPTFNIVLNQWYYVTYTISYISGWYTITSYFNGIFDKTHNFPNAYNFADYDRATNTIGSRNGANPFGGQIYDLRFYSKVLNDDEVLQIYNESLNKYNKFVKQPSLDTQLNKDLFLWIKPDEETIDQLNNYGNSNITITPTNTPSIIKNFNTNKNALYFDGVNQYLELSTIPGSYFNNGFTFTGWTKIENTGPNDGIIDFSNSGTSNVITVTTGNSNTALSIYYGDSSNTVLTNTGFFEVDNWIFYSITSDDLSNTTLIYKNGVINTINTTPFTISDTSRSINSIGRSTSGDYYDGQMADVKLYSRVLTPSEIKSLYEQSFEKYDYINSQLKKNNISHFSIQNQLINTENINTYNFNSPHENKLLLHLTAQDITTYPDSITDYSGYAHQGSNTNITNETSSVIISSSALGFNGTSSYIECSAPETNLDYDFLGIPGIKDRTFSTWMYLSSNTTTQPLLSYGSNTNVENEFFNVYVDTDARLVAELGITTQKFEKRFNTSEWYHISIEVDNNTSITNPNKYLKSYYASGTNDNKMMENTMYELTDLDNDPDLFIHLPLDNSHTVDSGTITKDNTGLFNASIINNPTVGGPDSNIYNNYYMDFDGTSDYLRLNTIQESYFNNGLSFTGWIYIRTRNDYDRFFTLSNATGTGNQDSIVFNMRTNASGFKLRIQIHDASGSGLVTIDTTSVFSLNTWYFVSMTATHDSSPYSYNIYANGELDLSTTDGNTYTNTDRSVNYIGSKQSADYAIDGNLFDLRFYSRILTNKEIKQIYNNTKSFINTETTTNNLRIGNGVTNSSISSNYFSGVMDDIRLYQRCLSIEELQYIWNSGSGSYTRGSNLENTAMIKYTNGSNLVVNSRIINQLGNEITYDTNRKLLNDDDDGLFMWFRGDENTGTIAYDYSGNGFNGTYSTSSSYTTLTLENKYKLSNCLDFDGTNDWIVLPTILAKYVAVNGFSFSGWVNMNSINNYERIFHFASSTINADAIALALLTSPVRFRLYIIDGGGTVRVSLDTSLSLSTSSWYHIAVTIEISSPFVYKIFVNGEYQVSTTTVGNYLNDNRQYCNIGRRQNGDYIFDGQMSDLRFYSRVLSAEEIRKQYLDKVSSGYLPNEAKTDQHSLRIMDFTHPTTETTSRLTGILEPTLYNFGSTENKFSSSMWVYPEYQQAGTLVSNAKSSSALASGDYRFMIAPTRYEDMFLWITGNDIELNQSSTTSAITSVYNSALNNISVSPINSPTLQTGPYRNNVIDFDGTSDYLELSTLPASYFDNGFTFTGWLNINTNPNDYGRIFYLSNSLSNNKEGIVFGIRINPLVFRIIIIDSSGATAFDDTTSPYTYSLNTWYHVCLSITHNTPITSTPNTYKIYVNGFEVLNQTDTSGQTTYNDVSRLYNYIGGSGTGTYNFTGQMFDLRWYSKVLSVDEIKQIYQRTQHLVFQYHNGSNWNTYQAITNIPLKEWSLLSMNYSNTGAGETGHIELYKNTQSVGSWSISSGIPSLNTSNIIIGTTQYSGNNHAVFQGEICDIIIKPDITFTETLETVYNMNAKCVLDIQALDSTLLQSNEQHLASNIVIDNSFYIDYPTNGTDTNNYIAHTINTLQATNTISKAGLNNVLYFDGTDDYLQLTGSLSKNPIYNFNISGWIYPDGTKSTGDGYIISKWGATANTQVFTTYYDFANDELEYQYQTFDGNNILNTVSLSNNSWAYISINTVNKEGSYIYVNGDLVSVKHDNREINDGRYNTVSNTTLYTSQNIFIGTDYNQGNDYQGWLKDIKVYKGILTQKTIKENYQKQKSRILTTNNITTKTSSTSSFINKNPQLEITSNLVLNLDTQDITNISISDNHILSNTKIDNSKIQQKLVLNDNANISIETGFDSTLSSLYLDNSGTGSNAYLITPTPVSTKTSNITISMWAKYSTASGHQYLFRNGNADDGYGILLENSNLAFSNTNTTSSNIYLSPNQSLSTNTWYHIAYVNNYGTSNIFINGTKYALTSATPVLDTPVSLSSIGATIDESVVSSLYSSTVNNKLTGYIQDLKVYDKALTDSEIEFLALKNTTQQNYTSSVINLDSKIPTTQSTQSRLYTSKYSTDTNNNLDVPLPTIARDNLLVHYSPDTYSGTTLTDLSSTYKSDYLYRNATFTRKIAGKTTYNGTLSNATITTSTSGPISKTAAIEFNGSNAYLTVASGANLNTNSNVNSGWSISAWVNPENLDKNSNNVIWCKSNVGAYSTGAIRLAIDNDNSNKLYLGIAGGSLYDTNIVVEEGVWSLLTTTFGIKGNTSNVVTMYYNDNKIYDAVNTGIAIPSPSTSDVIYFGASDTTLQSNTFFSGYMDNIQIWDTKLNDFEVERLYMGKSTLGPVNHWIATNDYNSTYINDLGSLGDKLTLSNVALTLLQSSDNINNINNKVFEFDSSITAYALSSGFGVLGDNPRSYSMWFNVDSVATERTLLDIGATSTGNKFKIAVNTSSKIGVSIDTTTTILSTDTISTGRWYHLCVIVLSNKFYNSFSRGTAKNIVIFLDGKDVTDVTTQSTTIINTRTPSPTSTNSTMYIGSENDTSNLFSGFMDDIRIYNVSLAPDEIINLYENSRNYRVVDLN